MALVMRCFFAPPSARAAPRMARLLASVAQPVKMISSAWRRSAWPLLPLPVPPPVSPSARKCGLKTGCRNVRADKARWRPPLPAPPGWWRCSRDRPGRSCVRLLRDGCPRRLVLLYQPASVVNAQILPARRVSSLRPRSGVRWRSWRCRPRQSPFQVVEPVVTIGDQILAVRHEEIELAVRGDQFADHCQACERSATSAAGE